MILILLFTIDTYDETVSVNPDTSYLRWNSTFPAISLCYAKGRTNQLSNFLKEHWAVTNFTPPKSTNYLWPKMAQTYLFVSPNSNLDEDITAICAGLNSTCNLNLKVMKNRVIYCFTSGYASLFIISYLFIISNCLFPVSSIRLQRCSFRCEVCW
uniref:Uncharacterized protein n=1 Tax=Anopheles maculatus TaxID=74869 RepID=A0A182S711_9DIPT